MRMFFLFKKKKEKRKEKKRNEDVLISREIGREVSPGPTKSQ